MLKGIKVRIYPTKEQKRYLAKLFGTYRFVYNKCLDKYITDYNELGIKYSAWDLHKYFHHELRSNNEYEWIKEHNTKVLKQSIKHLLTAYGRYFKKTSNFPKFKSKYNKQSCKFPIEAISRTNNYETSNKLTLTGQLKDLRFKCSQKYKSYLQENKKNILSATLSKKRSGNYYLSFVVEGDNLKKVPEPVNDIIGLDLGIKNFVITSENQIFENKYFLKSEEKKLKRLQQNVSRKQKGSKNRNKAIIKLAKKYEQIKNKKTNYLHKVSNSLINENQVIVMEDLNVNGMLKNKNLSKSIQHLSFNEFKNIIKYKCEWYGRTFIQIGRYFPSSKLCSNCGEKNKNLTLGDREWICNNCESVHDRDYNASINIRNEGKRLLNTYP